jgi:hypothetical protein
MCTTNVLFCIVYFILFLLQLMLICFMFSFICHCWIRWFSSSAAWKWMLMDFSSKRRFTIVWSAKWILIVVVKSTRPDQYNYLIAMRLLLKFLTTTTRCMLADVMFFCTFLKVLNDNHEQCYVLLITHYIPFAFWSTILWSRQIHGGLSTAYIIM